MIRQAQPTVSFTARVTSEVDERRRRLQRQMGCALPGLLDKALRVLEYCLSTPDNASTARALSREQEASRGTSSGRRRRRAP
jgi:hypothetical protein